MSNSTSNVTQTDFEFCFLPSNLLEYPETLTDCPPQSSQLVSLLLFNAFSAAFNLFLGHDYTRRAIRDNMPSFLSFLKSKSEDWQPWAAVCMTILQILGMIISTGIARSNGFTASFGALLGLWSLRPRMALLTFIYDSWDYISCFRSKQWSKPFRYTLRDTILSECLLNILQRTGQDNFDCQSKYTEQDGQQPSWFVPMKIALGWKICAGVVSLFVLAGQFLNHLGHAYRRKELQHDTSHHQRHKKRHRKRDHEASYETERIERDLEGSLVFWVSLFVTFVNFITSWEIWGGE